MSDHVDIERQLAEYGDTLSQPEDHEIQGLIFNARARLISNRFMVEHLKRVNAALLEAADMVKLPPHLLLDPMCTNLIASIDVLRARLRALATPPAAPERKA